MGQIVGPGQRDGVGGAACGASHWLKIGGPAHLFPPLLFFLARPFFLFFCSGGNREHPKTDRRQTKSRKERPFFAKMIIPPPIVAIFRLISSSADRSMGKLGTVSARTI